MATLGVDLYSLRSQGWNAFEYLEYCAAQGVGVVHFSEIRFLGSLDDSHLRGIRIRAEELGLKIEIGMGSICPSSNLFDASQGPAEDQLSRMIHAARIVGSPIVRAVMGNRYDRWGDAPIETHIANTVRVLRGVRSLALDAGIKIAVENHDGDMGASELKMLIEDAGTDFVGACLDSGNLPTTLAVPLAALELLAPYILTSHIRDSAIWRTPQGVAVTWVPMGEGTVRIREYLRRHLELCPDRTLSLEIITIEPRYLNVMDPDFMAAYRSIPPRELEDYLSLAQHGRPPKCLEPPAGDPATLERQNLEASIRFCYLRD